MRSVSLPLLAACGWGVAGLVLLFAPQEAAVWLGLDPAPPAPWLMQVLGCALLGLAVMNWLQRKAAVGGIYGRPLVLMNLAFALPAFLSGIREVVARPGVLLTCVVCVIGLFAVAFSLRLYGAPPGSGPARG